MKRILIGFLFIVSITINYAQKEYKIESLTVADGLSQGFIYSIFEDSRGYKWFGTFNGLNRYDGYQVKRFIPDNSTPRSLKANHIYCIIEDEHGLLWLGTDKGLVIMDPYSEQFVHMTDVDPKFPLTDVVGVDIRAGRIWVSGRVKAAASVVNSLIYTVTPASDLARLIRENKLSPSAFNLQFIDFPSGYKGPALWVHIPNSKSTDILFIDQLDQLGTINVNTLKAASADPRLIDYPRMGPFGLLHFPVGKAGRVFCILENTANKHTINSLAEFIQPYGQTPLFYRIGDTVISQLDTILAGKKSISSNSNIFQQQFKPFFTLGHLSSFCGMVDRNNNLWLGTNGFGVRKMRQKKLSFKQFLLPPSTFNFNILPDGRVWPGRNFPFEVLNQYTNKVEPAPWSHLYSKGMRVFNLLMTRSGDWWLPTSKNNHLFIQKKECHTGLWKEIPIELPYLDSGTIPIFEDRNANIWISAINGKIARIRPDDNQIDYWSFDTGFQKQQQGITLQSTCIVEDTQGTLWLGSNQGLVRIEHPEGAPVFKIWHNYGPKGVLFKNDQISSIYPDPNQPHLIWIGTFGGGLHCFDSQKETATIYGEKDGLADNVVYGVLPDAFGYLWLSTNRGLSRFDRQNKIFYNLSSDDQKLSTEFNTDAFRLLPSGELAFGGLDGLFLVRPLPENQNKQANIVAITEVKINGILINPAIEAPFIRFTDQNEVSLRLPFDKNSITVEFAALQTSNPLSANFRYRLLGFDDQWINAGAQRTANFTLIPPGKYTLEVQSVNSKENWENAPITRLIVTITPPWYRSWYAWVLYAGIFAGLIYTYLRYERRYIILKYKESIHQKEVDRLKSLDEYKNRFFGSISHEFKTPLAIILGHAKRLRSNNDQQNLTQSTEAIIQQGESMLDMVTQIIDVTRLEHNEIELNWRNGLISAYINYLVESLRPLTDFKNIQLIFETTEPDLQIDFDPTRLKYIVNNLLSNAVRHTPQDGQISISVHAHEQDHILLEIQDTGEGIPPENLPYIFDRYFQGFDSSNPQGELHFGIGLSFVKDLVSLFGGTISVNSQLGLGTRFSILLPIKNVATPFDASSLAPIHTHTSFTPVLSNSQLPLLLIVEDNPFINAFLQSTLLPHFTLDFASDGLLGYDKAIETIPDLILTDVMMPGIDGYEMTSRLKKNELTSHIPIVILSARSELSDRLTGQQFGANAYIGKPFDEQELVLTLQGLYNLRLKWHERYADLMTKEGLTSLAQTPFDQISSITSQTGDLHTDAFMWKIYDIFELNYADEDYDLFRLCSDLNMSKSQVQRKLTALSDQSAMQLLRQFRLQKAYEILSKDGSKNVKEVCFMVGFKDPAHFSRLFSQTFNIAPSNVKQGLASSPKEVAPFPKD